MIDRQNDAKQINNGFSLAHTFLYHWYAPVWKLLLSLRTSLSVSFKCKWSAKFRRAPPPIYWLLSIKRMRISSAQCSHGGSNYPNKYRKHAALSHFCFSRAALEALAWQTTRANQVFYKHKATAPSRGSLTAAIRVAGREIASWFSHKRAPNYSRMRHAHLSLDYQKIKTIAATQLAVNQFACCLVIYQCNHHTQSVQIGKMFSRNRVQIWQAASLIWLHLQGKCIN